MPNVCTYTYKIKGDDHTHTAERFAQMTSATAVARTGPTQRAQHDSEVSRRETRMPPPPQTVPSGTTPGNTGMAAGSQRNGTRLLERRRQRETINTLTFLD